MNNILGRQIIYGGKPASYDAACKRLLSNRVILAWILKSCLKEYRACEISEIAERYLEEEFQIATTGELEQEVRDMCNLSEGVLEQGIEIGLEQGKIEGKREGIINGIVMSLKNLMESMNWSAGQAMDALKIPKEERERYGRLLR